MRTEDVGEGGFHCVVQINNLYVEKGENETLQGYSRSVRVLQHAGLEESSAVPASQKNLIYFFVSKQGIMGRTHI